MAEKKVSDCVECGKPIRPRRSKDPDRQGKFCSVVCYRVATTRGDYHQNTPQFCPQGHDTYVVGRRISPSNGRPSTCAECARAAVRKWHRENRDRVYANTARYVAKHGDAIRERASRKAREFREANPAAARKRDHAKYRNNIVHYRKKGVEYVNRRRARKYANGAEPYDYDAIVFGATHCALCGEQYREGDRRSIDHIVPIVRGGPDSPDNVQSAHFNCNSRKGARVAA